MAIVPTVLARKISGTGIDFPYTSPGYVSWTMRHDDEIADTEGNGFVPSGSPPGNTKLYARVAGTYMVYADVEYYLSGGRNRDFKVRVNGSTDILSSDHNTNAGPYGGAQRWNMSGLWKFNQDDYVELHTGAKQHTYNADYVEYDVVIRGGLGLSKVASGIGARVTSPSGPGTVQWASETFDDGGLFDSGSNTRLTAPSDGLYYIASQVRWGEDTLGLPVVPYIFPNISPPSYTYEYDGPVRTSSIRLNGSSIIARDSRHCGTINTREYFLMKIENNLACIYLLNAGDYVELVAEHDGGTVSTLLSGSCFCMAKLI